MLNLSKHKKGMDGPSTLGKFIIVFILVFVLIAIFNKTLRGSTKVMECATNGGECTTGTCQWGKQIPALADKAAGCKEGEICCINITKAESVPDPECAEKKLGDYCGTGTLTEQRLKACNKANKCVTLCEFCSQNAQTLPANLQAICTKQAGDISKFVKGGFSCSCPRAACSTTGTDTCMANYCPASTNTDAYRCCIPTKR